MDRLPLINHGLSDDEKHVKYGKAVIDAMILNEKPYDSWRPLDSMVQNALSKVDCLFFKQSDYVLDKLQPSFFRSHFYFRRPAFTYEPLPTTEIYKAFSILQLRAGESFLLIGSESGYGSFVAGYILGPHGLNHGLESDAAAFRLSTMRAKEILVCLPHLQDTIAFPTFYNCHVTQLPKDRKYDAILCMSVSSASDRQHISALLRPCGRALLSFEELGSQTDAGYPVYQKTRLHKHGTTGDDVDIRISQPFVQTGRLSTRHQSKTEDFEFLDSTLEQRCLLAVNQKILAALPSAPASVDSIIMDWDAVLSMKFVGAIDVARELISRCLNALCSFESKVKKEETNSAGLLSVMTDLKLSFRQLMKRKHEFIISGDLFLPWGIRPSFSFSVITMNHLHVLPSLLLLIVEEVTNKAAKQLCALSGTQTTPGEEPSWRAELDEEWLASFRHQAKRLNNEPTSDEEVLSCFDFQKARYFHDLDLYTVFAFKRIVWTLTSDVVGELLVLLDSESVLEQVTSPSTTVAVEEMKSTLASIRDLDIFRGMRVLNSPKDAKVTHSMIDLYIARLFTQITCSLDLYELIGLVSNEALRRRLLEMWWTLQTLRNIHSLVCRVIIPQTHEPPFSDNNHAIHAISERFLSSLVTCDVCSPHVWTGMLLLLSRCVGRLFDSADRMLSRGKGSRVEQYREKLQSPTLILPAVIKEKLHENIPLVEGCSK